MTLLTVDQFISNAEAIFDDLEGLCEQISEAQSEINMFGDAGPGVMRHLRQTQDELHSIARQYNRLTGRTLRVPRFPVYPSSHYTPEDEGI